MSALSADAAARARAGFKLGELTRRIPQLPAWERGETRPTLRQIERFARATYTPVGFLFLQEPPIERVPIPDLRTAGNERIERPSPDLLDTGYACQQRQEWYRGVARSVRDNPAPFVGSARLTSDVETTAASMQGALGFDLDECRHTPTWTDALRRFIERADGLGILVMFSGVVLRPAPAMLPA